MKSKPTEKYINNWRRTAICWFKLRSILRLQEENNSVTASTGHRRKKGILMKMGRETHKTSKHGFRRVLWELEPQVGSYRNEEADFEINGFPFLSISLHCKVKSRTTGKQRKRN